MTRLLPLVGAPQEVMKLVAEIVGACRICRTRARGPPHARTSAKGAMMFIQSIRGHILFYSGETGAHIRSFIM
eukprot:6073273-Pyramimonas_sp.AAC.1